VRTQDLNRYEGLARRLSHDQVLDPAEVADVLQATGHTQADLETRARFLRERRGQLVRAKNLEVGDLERYQEEAKVLGVHEGLWIVMAPLGLFLIACVGVLVALTR
jgi:hypothetical protein